MLPEQTPITIRTNKRTESIPAIKGSFIESRIMFVVQPVKPNFDSLLVNRYEWESIYRMNLFEVIVVC